MFHLKFKQQILAGFIISLLLVFGMGVSSFVNVEQQEENSKWIRHSREIIRVANNIYNKTLNTESAQRGFAVTGMYEFLQPYEADKAELPKAIAELRALTLNHPLQARKVEDLAGYVQLKIQENDKIIMARQQGGLEEAKARMTSGEGRLYMHKVREAIKAINQEENRLLHVREYMVQQSTSRSFFTIFISSGLILVIVVLMFFFIQRTFNRQRLAEKKVLESNIVLEKLSEENKARNWLLTGTLQLNEQLRGENEVHELCNKIIATVAKYSGATIGALYLVNDDKSLQLTASYAYDIRKGEHSRIMPGEGLLGQAYLEKKAIIFSNVPKDYVQIVSALGKTTPSVVAVVPCLHDDEVKGVMELGFAGSFAPEKKEFFDMVAENIGIAIHAALSRKKLKELYEKTQQQAEELEAQQEELRITNEELYKQTQMLQASEEELRVQQEELKQANAELEDKANLLQEKNEAIERARESIMTKAHELEVTGKYKSEFLANMSHELRTPLNSILILAKMLTENKNQNLTDDEIKYARVIHTAGQDLLTLINDILDLSKIEAGKIELQIESFDLEDMRTDLQLLFNEVAQNKKITYNAILEEGTPSPIHSDRVRVEQVVKNLLSNAFKFTSEGGQVDLTIRKAPPGTVYQNESLTGKEMIAISVSDTGIGIPEDKLKIIFEAFQQADGSTNRKYGGTGLGLSISRELAHLLGGEIHVKSTVDEGSIFTFFLPVSTSVKESKPAKASKKSLPEPEKPKMAQAPEEPGDKPGPVLIVEDDPSFSGVLKAFAEKAGFTTIHTDEGERVLDIAKTQRPSAIILDIKLPGTDGWSVLKQLKADEETHSIPVHVISAVEEKSGKAKKLGAISFIRKPVDTARLEQVFTELKNLSSPNLRSVLIVEDNELHSNALKRLLASEDIDAEQAFTAKEALELLQKKTFDCIVLDIQLPDINGLDLLDKIRAIPELESLPAVINTSAALDEKTVTKVQHYGNAIVVKSTKSNERLLDEINLFFNKIKSKEKNNEPVKPARSAQRPVTPIKDLKNKKVLLVDDDMRNVYALSQALHQYDLSIELASNGQEALDRLEKTDSVDMVLMDIMMPGMDGFTAMKEIRKNPKWKDLPIIAVTSKAMKNDREKCIEAGASDYISKPVEIEKLINLMKVWFNKT